MTTNRPTPAAAADLEHLALGVATPEAQLKWKRRLNDAGLHIRVDGQDHQGNFRVPGLRPLLLLDLVLVIGYRRARHPPGVGAALEPLDDG